MTLGRVAGLVLQASSWFQNQIPNNNPTSSISQDFDWDTTPVHSHFEWHNCYNDFKCARLRVPMDWLGNSTDVNKSVDLAVIKLEATVPVTDEAYGGAVVLNPGGPGGSGIGQVIRGGRAVRTILSAGREADKQSARHFDIIGFDPRGVNNSRPILTCFPNENDAAAWNLQRGTYGFIDASDKTFDYLWASERAKAEGCSKRAAEEGIGKHMSTAPVARDIVEIFERHGQWRESEARRLLKAESIADTERRNAILQRTAYVKGEEMVQYWGFSYGSILGATLSAMYPDRIKRAVLDGVSDSHDYMKAGWTTNLRDTDLLIIRLAKYCFEGGPTNCAIYDAGGPDIIVANLERTLEALWSNPISIPGNHTHGPAVVTLNDLQLFIREIVYNPLKQFPTTAKVLQELSTGIASTLHAWKETQMPKVGKPLDPRCHKDGPFSPACFSQEQDATFGITCSDGESRLHETKEQYRHYADNIIGQSKLMGQNWAGILLPCTAWHARANWRYDGDFKTTTANPILFAGNTVDPVTPLHNAFKMARDFERSGVLHQNSEGHCTYGSVSMCTGRAIRHYFQTGELPGAAGEVEGWGGKGAVCEPDRLPFDGYSSDSMPALPSNEEDEELWEALVTLNWEWP